MTATVPHRPLLNVASAAKQLSVSEKTVRRLISAGRLPAVKVGAQMRIDQAELDAYVYGPGEAA
jgi:excisionase family DNA binding protein